MIARELVKLPFAFSSGLMRGSSGVLQALCTMSMEVAGRADDVKTMKHVGARDPKRHRSSRRDAHHRRPEHVELGAHHHRDTAIGSGHDAGGGELARDVERLGIDRFDVAGRMCRAGHSSGDDGSGEERQHAGGRPHPVAFVALDLRACCWPTE